MRLSRSLAAAVAALVVLATGATSVGAKTGGGGGMSHPPGQHETPPATHEDGDFTGTQPGLPGGVSDDDQPANGCPPGDTNFWQPNPEMLALARKGPYVTATEASVGLRESDLAVERASHGFGIWFSCLSADVEPVSGMRIRYFDYLSTGAPAIAFRDILQAPQLQFHPPDHRLVVGFPTWLAIENYGTAAFHNLPAGLNNEFRPVYHQVRWHTGATENGHETVVDCTGRDLQPRPADAEPPADACQYAYARPSTSAPDGFLAVTVEVVYRVEFRPTGSNGAWQLYPNAANPVEIPTSTTVPVRVTEIQAVGTDR